MKNEENKNKNFTIVPNNNEELYKLNKAFNILHVYIVERIRSFERKGIPCYITNQQLAESTGTSEKTISRAIKLLLDQKVLWAGYHYETTGKNVKEQRILRIFNTELEEYYNKTHGQIVQKSGSNCPDEMDKMTSSDGQNDPLEYKENKEYKYKKSDEFNPSPLASHNAQPENVIHIFGDAYKDVGRRRRRALNDLENALSETL